MDTDYSDEHADNHVHLHVLQGFQPTTLFRHRCSISDSLLFNRAVQPSNGKRRAVAPGTSLGSTRTPLLRSVLAVLRL